MIKDEGVDKVSANVMKKAQRLKVEKSDSSWLVSGGNEPHIVEISLEYEFKCDCVGFVMRKSCSHVLAVKLHTEKISKEEEPKELELWELDPLYLGC